MVTEIWNVNVEPRIDSYIMPDGWTFGSRLIAGDSFSNFRLPTNSGGPVKDLAVEIEVTGRTFQRKQGLRVVRVKITFPGDGEPDTVTHGYMAID